MKIIKLKIKNFKALRNVEMQDIPNFCVIVGANGSGKSTLFNVFEFLRESLRSNVHTALRKQGGSKGFREVISRGVQDGEKIEIEIQYKTEKVKTKRGHQPRITYILHIGYEGNQAIVSKEVIKYRRGGRGKPWEFLNFAKGEGTAVTNEGIENIETENQLTRDNATLKEKNILAIKGLAQFEKFPAVVALGDLIENWHLSDLHINQARNEQEAGFAEHLSREGENLSLVIDYLYQNHHDQLNTIIEKLKKRIPGIVDVESKTIETGQVLLKLTDKSFSEPFLVRYVSDGTIKMLAYLVLLYDPKPHPLLCVEEPENQLYPTLLAELAEEFRHYAGNDNQVFVTTHSPDLLNSVELDEVFWLVKEKGYTSIKRAQADEQVKAYMEQGDQMGYLWKQGIFKNVNP